MNIFSVDFENWYTIVVEINWLLIILALAIIIIIFHLTKKEFLFSINNQLP